MPHYLIDYFCFIVCLINVKLCASLPLSFVALSFSALEHIRKYPALLSRGKSIHRCSMAKIEFFCNTLTKTMDKNKGRPTSLPVESTGKCKIRLFFWRTQLLVFQTSAFVCVYCWYSSVCSTSFYLWDHRNWLTGECAVWWVYHSNLG